MDACIPGDIVTVTGIIRVINNYMDIGGGKEGVMKEPQFFHNLTSGVVHEFLSPNLDSFSFIIYVLYLTLCSS